MTKYLIKKSLPYILSYLDANPNDESFTDIYATSMKSREHNRNEKNGFSQFQIKYNRIIGQQTDGNPFCRCESKSIRIEKNFFQNRLSLFEKSQSYINKADFIIFGDYNSLYISISSETFGNSWVQDPKYYNVKGIHLPFGKQIVYEYNIDKLLEDGQIYRVCEYTADCKCFTLYNGTLENPNKKEVIFLDKYENVASKVDNLQVYFDPRAASLIFFTFWGYRYTDTPITIPNLAQEIHKITGDPINNIQQKLYKAKQIMRKENRAKPVIFDLSEIREKYIIEGLQYDPDIIENHKLIVFISFEKHWDIVEHEKELKTKDIKEYQKEYQKENNESLKLYRKVYYWLKRHNNQQNPKWGNEEKEIASKILSK